MKPNKIRVINNPEITSRIIKKQRDLFELKFKKTTRQTVKNHLFKKYKRTLAQMLTIQHSKNKQ